MGLKGAALGVGARRVLFAVVVPKLLPTVWSALRW